MKVATDNAKYFLRNTASFGNYFVNPAMIASACMSMIREDGKTWAKWEMQIIVGKKCTAVQ